MGIGAWQSEKDYVKKGKSQQSSQGKMFLSYTN